MISREDMIVQSVTDYVRHAIFDVRGYPASQVEMLESFPFDFKDREFDRNFVTLGFNFDDMGEQAELGSHLLRRVYTIEFFIFGLSATYGSNLANIVKFSLQNDQSIPLKDISDLAAPVIDQLEVMGVSAQRQIIANPEPWQEFIWTVHLHLQDVYNGALV